MDSLLQEITALPGVFGCFVYSGKRQIAGSQMPPIFRKNNINAIGSLLARTIQIGRTAQLGFKEVEIKYNESMLIIRPLENEALLVLICEPNANKSLIAMTAGMLATDIEIAIARGIIAQPISSTPSRPPETIQANQVEETKINEEITPVLEQIKKALAMAIGPIAAPVMKDNIEIWSKQHRPSLSSLPALEKLLCSEINNKVLAQKFMAEVKKFTG